VLGIEADEDRIRNLLQRSIGIVTALVPYIGYEKSTTLAREAQETGRGVYDLVLEKGWLERAQLDDILSPDAMTKPRAMPQRTS
jgi:aspartate ammonia-lyase